MYLTLTLNILNDELRFFNTVFLESSFLRLPIRVNDDNIIFEETDLLVSKYLNYNYCIIQTRCMAFTLDGRSRLLIVPTSHAYLMEYINCKL